MKEIEIHTFAELHEIIETYDERTIIYRGMKSAEFPLIDRFSLFPSLDGLASHIEWLQSRSE